MHSRDLTWKAAALISALCISAAYALGRQWALIAITLVVVGLCVGARCPPRAMRSTLFLAMNTALAAAGMYLVLSVPLLVMGTAAALAAWDLAHFAERLSLTVSGEHDARLRRFHLLSLVAAVASGPVLAFLASVVRLQLSFGVVSLLALILVLSLAGIPRAIKAGAGRS